MPGLRFVFAAATAVLPLLNIVNTLKPVPVFFGPQTYREFIDDLYEEAFAPDTFGRPLPELKDVWRFFDSTIVLASLPGEIEDSPSVVLTPMSPPREYPSSLLMDFEQPTYRPRLAISMTLDLITSHSSTRLAEPAARPVDPAHSIVPTSIPPPPSAAYHTRLCPLGGILFRLFVLAAVILDLRWAMAPTSSTMPSTTTISASVRPSVVPSFDAVGEFSSATSCARIFPLLEDLDLK
ncbi:hypothetical protein MSAN_01148800 [Mycena sanguinolenta]|uniref:Uncharacterized protein n=1 Tax=Mycena sanguinolenta TaxID=230812 RepID=A0A8H6YLE1_9AGAR|nr:hypothetical protein MSAN_01148800 [Mycena sanguinolenta]